MQLSLSHVALSVRDLEPMVGFYTGILGFEETDRGFDGPGGPEIVFLSQDPREHHQLAIWVDPENDGKTNVDHLSFRTGSLDDVRAVHGKLVALDYDPKILPLSHGNTLSIYFNDPEGNGLEVYAETPWHVVQPQGEPWDIGLDNEALRKWVYETFSDKEGFEPIEDYYERRRQAAKGK